MSRKNAISTVPLSITSPLIEKIIRYFSRIAVCAFIACLFVDIVTGLALSDNGGYIIIPNNSSVESIYSDYDGYDKQISFFELPLWIQIFYISSTLSVLASLSLFLPLGIKKVRSITGQKRSNIQAYVSDNPGCPVSEICQRENIPRGTVRYHIERLIKEGKIIVMKSGKHLRIFPNGRTAGEREKIIQSFMQCKNYRMLLMMILNRDSISNQELSEQLKIDKSQTYRQLQKLLKNKIIEFKRDGKTKQYYITEEIKPFIIELFAYYLISP